MPGRRTRRALSIAVTAVIAGLLLYDMRTRPDPPPESDAPPISPSASQRTAPSPAVEAVLLPAPPPPAPAPAASPAPAPRVKPIVPLKPTPRPKPASQPAVEPLRPSTRPALKRPVVEVEPLTPVVPRPAPKPPEPPAEVRAERPPEPPPETDAKAASTVVPDLATVADGRVLLRILEHGEGPVVEIGWPASGTARARLYGLFRRCYGMRLALMDGDGRLFVADGARGRPWNPDLDRYTGFVRQPEGRLTADERREAEDIHAFHGGLRAASPVRLFPRRVDALLLGGFRRLIGEDYGSARTIHASYRLVGGGVRVDGIEVDGRRLDGAVDLSRAAASACR